MVKHYRVEINRDSEYAWERLDVKPCVGEFKSLEQIIAEQLGNKNGQYLVQVEVSICVIEQNTQSKPPREEMTTEQLVELNF
jgi:hypothetical protein